MEYVAAANAAIALLNVLIPIIQKAAASGEVTVEQQAELKKQIDSNHEWTVRELRLPPEK